jgi:hypothetical protein
VEYTDNPSDTPNIVCDDCYIIMNDTLDKHIAKGSRCK